MKVLVIFAALMALASAGLRSRLDSQEVRLNQLTARFQGLSNSVQSQEDADSAVSGRVTALEGRLDDSFGDGCGKGQFQCGGSIPQCISIVSVCDGYANCKNGADEQVCENPLEAGSSWEGQVVYDYCTNRRPEKITFEVTDVETKDWFENKAFVSTKFILRSSRLDGTETAVFLSEGTYCYGCRLMDTKPPEDDNLSLICKFDQGDCRRCSGYIVRASTGERCAKFAFVKQ